MELWEVATHPLTWTVMLFTQLLLTLLWYAIYRLYFSPVAGFPGPKLAALTFWYEFYFDVIKGGQYIWEIEKMHDKYGPIVRINPYELHVSDPAFMKQLYPSTAKNVEKWAWSARQFGSNSMTFATVGHQFHRLRRQAFGKLFSKASIRNLEPTIQSIVDTMCRQFDSYRGTGEAINLGQIYSALTQDIITEYCFGKNRNTLLMPGFGPSYDSLMEKTKLCPLLKQFPLLVPVMSLLPPWIIDRVFPLLNSLKAVRKAMFQFVQGFLEQYQRGDQKSSHVTVFHTILADPDLPASEKTPDRLAWEAQLFLGAGTLTTAHFLLSTTYHVLANPPVLEKLLNELDTEVAKHGMPLSWQTLEHLPYLNAVINEGLRISYSIMGRLTRVHPDTTLSFNNWTIPPGTPVSMSSPLIHNDTTLFPNSYVFDPNRWLGTPEQTQYLEQYLFNFGKGTRMCAGTNLAYAEFYLALAAVFGRFGRELVLWDTERERDVDPVRDYFNACPGKDSRGVRVIVGEKKG